jgi:alpha-glucoside transport system substrate-binding protein
VRRTLVLAGASAALLALAGCSSGTAAETETTTAAESAAASQAAASSDALVAAATEAARRIVGNQELSGSVTILGALGGDQLDQFMAAFKPFEDASGVKVEYEGTRDMLSVLQTRVQGGNPPDLVSNPSIGQMKQLMASGDLIALDDVLDMETVRKDYDSGLLDLGTHDGKLYGIMETAALKGLVYYDPETYKGPAAPKSWTELNDWAKQFAASGTTPWCVGIESGAASGWLATDWIEQFVLTNYGTQTWDAWASGDLPWTSPEIKSAFEAFGAIATDPAMVNGGPTAVVSTDFIQGSLPLWADPARCALTLQADWLGTTVVAQVPGTAEGKDVDFFLFPPVTEANAGLVETAGEMVGAFHDTPEVRAMLQYLVTPESQALLASSGSWLAPNRSVPTAAYPTPARQKAAEILSGATGVRFDASDLMPQAVNEAFWDATLTYLGDPSKLDDALQSVEAARLANK